MLCKQFSSDTIRFLVKLYVPDYQRFMKTWILDYGK